MTSYLYDDANRLTDVNGVTYTWDANGNLLSDGTKTYTYDSANRLKAVSGQQVAISYAYNGMGDRLRETTNGQTTNFTMDLNAGLTQVLNDGTNNYIYGNGRIAQVNTGTDYFLGDALGSVRQLTNNSGAITYASAYDPYGVTTQAYGASQTAYGFTGEYTSNDMMYLRARYYAPGMGRFLARDMWVGNANRPMSYNKWQYVYSNPINFTDPTGNEGVPPWVEEYLEGLRDKTEYCYNRGDSLCVWFSYRQLAEFGPLFGYPYASAHLLNFLNKGGDIEYVRPHSKWVFGDPIVKKPLRKATKEMWRLIHSNVKAGIMKGHVKTGMRDVGYPGEKTDLWYALGPFSVYIEADYEVSGCYDVLVKPVHYFSDEYDWHPELDLLAGGSVGGLADFKDEWAKSLVPNYAKEYKIIGSWSGPNKIYHFSNKWLDWSASKNTYSSWEYSGLWGLVDIFHFDD